MTAHGTKRRALTANALSCADCGAGLPPPDIHGASSCVYCGTEHRSDRSSQILAAASGYGQDDGFEDSGYFKHATPSYTPSYTHTHELEFEAARIPMTDEAVLGLLRQHFNSTDAVFVCPHVPPRKEQAARRAHVVHLPDSERILALYDSNLFGVDEPSGIGTSFVVTARRLCWKNAGEPACSMLWRDLDPDRLCLDRSQLFVSDSDAIVIMDDDDGVLDACANAFHVLSLSASVPRPTISGAVIKSPRDTFTNEDEIPCEHAPLEPPAAVPAMPPPPPAATSQYYDRQEEQVLDHACWHCRTPLYKTTPRCAYCGVMPKKRGWLRVG